MRLADAVRVFGTKAAIADALGIRPQNVAKWRDEVPECHRLRLLLVADGALTVPPEQVAQWRTEAERLQRAIEVAERPSLAS